jgi:hypothetical protein
MSGDATTIINSVRVLAGGQAFSEGQLRALQEDAAAIQDADLAERIAGESAILGLCGARDEEAYQDRMLEIFGNRTQIGFERMRRPPARGLKGRLLETLRRVLWSLMRWPHDWAAFQQNAVNEQSIKALALEVRLRRRESEALRARLEALERAVWQGTAAGDDVAGGAES